MRDDMNIFIIGIIFISVVGTVLHFTYEWSNHNKTIALFSAVNESTWEHIKIAITAYFLWMIVDGFIFGKMVNYFPAKLVGLVTIILLIPLLFYGYKIITKRSVLIIDISIFYIAITAAQMLSYLVLNMKDVQHIIIYISIVLLFILFGFYVLATLMPPENFIFKDPITKKYGIKGHK